MKLLVQGDDFGFTRAVTFGIADAIELGVLRNTGLFTNMPSATLAASLMPKFPQACFGIDFNIVSGPSVADPKMIPALVDDNGNFIRSGVRIKNPQFSTEQGRRAMFPYEQVYCEIKAQYDRFIELTGKKPGYLHGHSLMHEHYQEAIQQISKESGIPYSMNIIQKYQFGSLMHMPKGGKIKKEFDPVAQLNKNPEKNVLDNSDYLCSFEYAMIGGHPGYIDAELLELTTLSLERCKDLQMMTSDKIKAWIKDNNIELITYYDLY